MTTEVTVFFPEELLAEVDRIAQEEHRTRSELLVEAVRFYIEVRRGRRRPGDDLGVQLAVAIQDALARQASSAGDDSAADVRRWREGRC